MSTRRTTQNNTTPKTTTPEVDLQIVGGGLAGLVAANRAADRGLRVRLYEKTATPGGRAATRSYDGYQLNDGPHALYCNGALDRALRSLDIAVDAVAPKLKGARGTIGDRQDVLPQGPGSLLRTSLLSAGEKVKLARLMARIPKIDATGLGSITVADWIASEVGSTEGDLVELLRGLMTLTTYNSAVDVASADAAVHNLQMSLDAGVLYLRGGWQQIVDKLEKRAADSGLVDWVSANVTLIEPAPSAGWLCHHGAAGEAKTTTSPTVVVAAGGPQLADRLLGVSLSAAAGPPVRAAVLDLGLQRQPEIDVLIGLDNALYYSCHSVVGGLAPERHALVTLARYLRPDEDPDRYEVKAQLLAHAARAGIGQDDIVMDRYLHRLTVTHGMPLASRGGLVGRPPVAVPGRPGAFVAGDWVGPEGLLADASAASAVEAVDRVAAALGR